MSDPVPPWPEGPRRCPYCGEILIRRTCRCREVSTYLLRPVRTWFQARVARFVDKLAQQRQRSPWPWPRFDTPHG